MGFKPDYGLLFTYLGFRAEEKVTGKACAFILPRGEPSIQ